jgi:hypothetical protein
MTYFILFFIFCNFVLFLGLNPFTMAFLKGLKYNDEDINGSC